MAICDVCGKNSLLPERFGSVNICKVSFLKANGLLWKYQHDRYDEIEKQRQKALNSAHKQNFPERVVVAINEYFIHQLDTTVKCNCCKEYVKKLNKFGNTYICRECLSKLDTPAWRETQYENDIGVENNRQKILYIAEKNNFSPVVINEINLHFDQLLQNMVECDCCKEYVQNLNKFGNISICRQCLCKLDTDAWRKTKYEDNIDVENNRQRVLDIAEKYNFSSATISEINLHFDRFLQKGLLFTIDGKCGQKIKVFETHCVLTTKDQFDVETFSKLYGKVLKKRHPKESMFSNGAAKALARNVLTGGIVRTGINLATSAAINATADAVAPEKGMFRVVKGDFRIDYSTYSYVEFQRNCDEDIGFIRFVNTVCGGNPLEDIIFFFMGENAKPEAAYNSILAGISTEKNATLTPKEKIGRENVSAADEILKYKNLLDMGAITQEEYDAKKRELLG